MKLVILGDSHVVALGRAYAAKPADFVSPLPGGLAIGKLFSFPIALDTFFDNAHSERVAFCNQQINRKLEQLTGRPYFAVGDENVYVFSMAFTTTLFVRMSVWQKYRPWHVRRGKHRLLSDAVIQELALGHFSNILAFFRALTSLGLRLAALEAPPPRRDDPVISRHLAADALLEIDRLGRAAVRSSLNAMNIPIVNAPSAAYDDSPVHHGFMRSEFQLAGNDFHHANTTYGSLVVPSILELGAKLGAHLG